MPGCGKQNLRRTRAHGEISDSDLGAEIENVRPLHAGIGRFVDPTLGIRRIGMAEGANVNDVRVVGIDHDSADLSRIVEADMSPGRSSVGRFVHAIAGSQIFANGAFTRSRINDVGIRWSYHDRADRRYRLAVKNRLPGQSSIDRLPDSTANATEIKSRRIAGNATDRDGAASAKRANQAPFQAIKHFG